MKIAEDTGDPDAFRLAEQIRDKMPKEEDSRTPCPYCERKFAK